MRGHTAVNRIGECQIILTKGLDERGGMHARRGAKRIMADDRIIQRNHRVRGCRDLFAIFLQPGKILVDESHEPKIDKH